MLKVMIVDDEFIVRVGFKSSVEWEKIWLSGDSCHAVRVRKQ